jgi:hypothetical protein
MNGLITKFAVFLISFAVGIAAASLWSNYGPSATQELDTLIVAEGARLLRNVQSYDDVGPYERGRIEAASDIRNGMLKVKSLGLLTVAHTPYSKMLMHNYDIEFIDYGCVGTQEFGEYIRGYNEVSKAAIETRFGKGFLDRVFEQVVKDYKRSKLH